MHLITLEQPPMIHLDCEQHNEAVEVVKLFYQSWPGAIKEKDHNGLLPFHYASMVDGGNSLEVCMFLLQLWPEAI